MTANTIVIRQQAAHTTQQLSASASCSTTDTRKNLPPNEKCWRLNVLEESQWNGPLAKNDKTERAKGLGRKTRLEMGKAGNQITALKFQAGGDIRHPPPFFGERGGGRERERGGGGLWRHLHGHRPKLSAGCFLQRWECFMQETSP